MSDNAKFEKILSEIAELRKPEDEILTIQGVVDLTGLARATIYAKTSSLNGQPPELSHWKKGNKLYFSKKEIIGWMTSNRVAGRQEISQAAEAYVSR